MARPKNPENKYEPRHAKLGIPVLDKDGNLLTFDTKAAADVTADDIKKVLSFFDDCAEKDSSFKVDSAIDTVFKLKDEVSDQPAKRNGKGKVVSLPKDDVSDPSKSGEPGTDTNSSNTNTDNKTGEEEEEEEQEDNGGDKPNE